ncbi:hypothetical protein PIROE2DRAFT_11697 [Piromyces sp. E2]|nr:hypothetical protein PIROE2DRAFT_11697 [Piromyces sp. E2]|eukprot:OUM62099.1 hypothetical protein PIROE2DRAFT_11697 [Piromyces sp. E2]
MTNRNQFLDDNNIADPDQILLSIFKTTATTVTQLYKESLNQSTKSYKNGYKQCLLDLMHFASLQQHQRSPSAQTTNPGDRVALTLDELMTFYNNKQSQLNSLDENSSQTHSSMSNDNEIDNNNNVIENNNNTNNNNNNNNNIEDDINYQEINNSIEPSLQPTENKNIITSFNEKPNVVQHQVNEKPNLSELKANFNFPKAFTFRFNNDQLSPAFNNVNIFNPHDNMKRRFGNVNTIDFLGRTFNFNNFSNDSEEHLPPFKRNRWRKDDRMTE